MRNFQGPGMSEDQWGVEKFSGCRGGMACVGPKGFLEGAETKVQPCRNHFNTNSVKYDTGFLLTIHNLLGNENNYSTF